jgi:cytochrome P450
MRAEIGQPDAALPGAHSLMYSAFCWINRHPAVWRSIGAVLRMWPWLARLLPFAASQVAVKTVLTRPRSFSNLSHEPHLLAGEFMIGMDPGPTYDADRRLFWSILNMLQVERDADREAMARIEALRVAAGEPFDLIDDYLQWVVFAAIQPAFGAALDGIVAGRRDQQPDELSQRRYLVEIRHVAAQLFAGDLAPIPVKRRAELSAASLQARIDRMLPELSLSWPQAKTMEYAAIRRTAIGLGWVSHPVTVQSAALVFQELLGRPEAYGALRAAARECGKDVWTDATLRQLVTANVLELMRFRPIFPLLARAVPRATEYECAADRSAQAAGGSSVTVLSISALFDASGVPAPTRFCPHRAWGAEADMRYLMFGYGERQCPAKDHAVSMITSALIGLLTLPELRWADRRSSRMRYDGPMISRMRLRQAQ